jgi:cysteine desulfurase family protein (TIGR01976 family)
MNEFIRHQFPSLSRKIQGKSIVFLDGPAGTQVPESVIEAVSNYYRNSNSNLHGPFLFSEESDQVMDDARLAMADLLGAPGPENISFGQNMTTLNFALSRAIGRYLQPGDEILITQLDHEANRGPWLSLREMGIEVREIALLDNGTLDYQDFEFKINERTRLVAVGCSSNLLGTVNDIAHIRKVSHQYGAWLLVDAVHYAPHFPIDVQAMDCDFLLCSAYKFYGPHVGILYAKTGLLDRLPTDRLRTAAQYAPYSIETGTLNHAAIAGVTAAVDFLASLGKGQSRRQKILDILQIAQYHEFTLAKKLAEGIHQIPGYQIIGPGFESTQRAPTLAITLDGWHADEVGKALAQHNVFSWTGHFYALRAVEVLGLLPKGGVTRLGMSLYTQAEEIDQTLAILDQIRKKA